MVQFHKVGSVRAFEDVANQIKQAIVAGQYEPGEKLPSQQVLQETFGVSRATMLQALHMLERAGLIAIRPGTRGGAFVREPSSESITEPLELLFNLRGVSLEEVAEFRDWVEERTAMHAAIRATEEDIHDLEDIVTRMREQANEGMSVPQFTELDFAFHTALAKASKNRASHVVMQALAATLQDEYLLIPESALDPFCQTIERVLDAVKARKPDEAASAMKRHLSYGYGVMLQQLNVIGAEDHTPEALSARARTFAARERPAMSS